MAKDYEIAVLLDFYGEILTEKQRDVIDLYYNQDLSLAEIAVEYGITRQGVRDSIKRGEGLLTEMEEKLGFAKRHRTMKQSYDKVLEQVLLIESYNDQFCFSKEITEAADSIRKTIVSLTQTA